MSLLHNNTSLNSVSQSELLQQKSNVSFKILVITNNTGPINKLFYIGPNAELIKQSNAIVYDATFEEIEFSNFIDFDRFIRSLRPEQCIGLGESLHGFAKGLIGLKGQEDLMTNKISRSNEYTKSRDTQCILFDVDPDTQMTKKMLNITTPKLLDDAFIDIFGDKFTYVSRRIGYGSSYGIEKVDSKEPLTFNFSMHDPSFWIHKLYLYL